MKFLDIKGVKQFKEYNDSKYVTTEEVVGSTAGTLDFYTKSEVDTQLAAKQNTLVSGTSIKTINNQSLLGSGNISISGGGESSGDVNVIETVKVNGTALTPDANKAVNVTVPTETTVTNWGFTKNAGTVTGVKMNGTTNNPTSGIVDLGTVITSETSLSKGTGTGSGNAVTDISVSGHQITLTKGKTFLESYTETDPVFTASAAHGITSSDITSWNGKEDATNKVTSISASSTDTQYPSAKLLYDKLATKADINGNGQLLDVDGIFGSTDSLLYAVGTGNADGNEDKILATTDQIPIESTVSGWGFTKNTGTVTGVKMNGTTNNPTSGVVDLGTVITSETSLSKGTTSGNGNAVTDISVSGHQITLTKGTTFLTSETSLSKGSDSGSGNVVTDVSVSGHQITLTKGSTVPVATSANAGKIPRITSAGAWEYVTPSAIYSGSGTPSNGTGNNGDVYLQT